MDIACKDQIEIEGVVYNWFAPDMSAATCTVVERIAFIRDFLVGEIMVSFANQGADGVVAMNNFCAALIARIPIRLRRAGMPTNLAAALIETLLAARCQIAGCFGCQLWNQRKKII